MDHVCAWIGPVDEATGVFPDVDVLDCATGGRFSLPLHNLGAYLSGRLRGRHHLAVWTLNPEQAQTLWSAGLRAGRCTLNGRGELMLIRYPTSAGKIHVRTLTSHVPAEDLPDVPGVVALGELVEHLRAAWSGLRCEPKAATGATSLDLARRLNVPLGWRGWAGEDVEAATLRLDRHRAALYGGRCELLSGAAVYVAPGHKAPRDGAAARLPVVRVGHPIHHVDLRQAYAWASQLPLPDVWGYVRPDFDISRPGVANVTIALGGCAGVLGVRVLRGGEPQLVWPTRGRARGTWTNTALRRAAETGARIEDVHWAETYYSERPYLAETVRALLLASERMRRRAEREPEQRVQARLGRAATKRAAQQLWGKIGQGRTGFDWLPIEQLRAAEQREGGWWVGERRLIRVLGHLEGHAEVELEEQEYPAHSCPLWSAEVSAICTVRLSYAIARVEQAGGRVLYVDTDSVIFAGPQVFDIGPEIGDWRHEADGATWAAIWGPKSYQIAGHRHALAGVPRAQQLALLAGEGWLTEGALRLRSAKVRRNLIEPDAGWSESLGALE